MWLIHISGTARHCSRIGERKTTRPNSHSQTTLFASLRFLLPPLKVSVHTPPSFDLSLLIFHCYCYSSLCFWEFSGQATRLICMIRSKIKSLGVGSDLNSAFVFSFLLFVQILPWCIYLCELDSNSSLFRVSFDLLISVWAVVRWFHVTQVCI